MKNQRLSGRILSVGVIFVRLRRVALACVLIFWCLGGAAFAQCTLSEAEVWADVIQMPSWGYRYKHIQGVPGNSVQQSAATKMHDSDYCVSYVQSEAWVNPGGTPGVVTNGKGTPTWANGFRFGNLYGIHTGNTKHWYVNVPSENNFQWIYMGSLSSAIDLGSPPNPHGAQQCINMGGVWDEFLGTCEMQNCPIILDLDGNGYHLTGSATGVLFDIDADGVLDRVGWTALGQRDGFLVLDRNENGIIDDGSELFGTSTVLSDGTRARNGFVALAELDENGDGQVDENDSRFTQLRFWIDINNDAQSQPGELHTLNSAGVRTLGLGYEVIGRRDAHGNLLKLKGQAYVVKNGVARPRTMLDVFLDRQ